MKFSLDSGPANNVIRSYGHDFVQVDDRRLETSFVLTPEALQTDWAPKSVRELACEHWKLIVALEPEIVILGTGETQSFPHPSLLQALYDAGAGVEVMSNGAACRTYNIIRSEGRRVVAAIILESL